MNAETPFERSHISLGEGVLRCSLTMLVLVGIFFIGWAVAPGHMNEDTLDMYTQAVTGHFHDWHSPFVSEIWYFFGAGPSVLIATLGLTLLGFVFFTFQIYRRLGFSDNIACVLTLLTTYTPPVLAFLGSLLKDTWVAVLFLGAIWFSLKFYEVRRSFWLILRALFFGLSALIRPEFIIISSLFLLLEFVHPVVIQMRSRIQYLVLSFAIMGVTYIGLSVVVKSVETVEHTYTVQFIYLSDLADLSVLENKMLIPAPFLGGNDLATLKKHYRKTDMYPIFWVEPASEMLKLSRNPQDIKELREAWQAGLARQPLRYLVHRFEFLNAYMEMAHVHSSNIVPNPFHLALYHEPANRILLAYEDFNSHNVYQRHSVTFVGSLLLAVFLAWRRKFGDATSRLLVISLICGCVYQVLFSLLGISPAYRLGYAGVIVFWIAVYAVLVQAILTWVSARGKKDPRL